MFTEYNKNSKISRFFCHFICIFKQLHLYPKKIKSSSAQKQMEKAIK